VKTRKLILKKWESECGVVGRIYLAREGWNASFAVPVEKTSEFVNTAANALPFPWRDKFLRKAETLVEDGKDSCNNDANYDRQDSFFNRLHVRIRPKVVQDGLSPEDDKFLEDHITGVKHLPPDVWHETLHRITKKIEDGVIIDCRNLYETEIGRFRGAIPLPINYHREAVKALPDTLSQISPSYPVYIYCTGGVRCEKLAKILHVEGFTNVNQLQGGLYGYLKYSKTLQQRNQQQRETDTPETDHDGNNLFEGKIFSFDKRVMLQSHTDRCSKSDIISKCHQCNRTPSDSVTNCPVCGILFIQCNGCKRIHRGCCSKECMEEFATNNIPSEGTLKHDNHSESSNDRDARCKQREKELEVSQRHIDELRRRVKDTAGPRVYLPDLISRGIKTILTKRY